jgi:hypothetical protein
MEKVKIESRLSTMCGGELLPDRNLPGVEPISEFNA